MTPIDNDSLLHEMGERIAEIHADMRELKTLVSGRMGLIETVLRHEQSLSDLNKLRWKLVGAMTIISIVITAMAKAFF